jgi:chloramphenicol 3-O-phosphotransferase
MAAGKSTVARLLASRFARGVHLEGDVFRRNIVAGRVEPTPDLPPAALDQLRLRYRLAAAAADGYRDAGFSVVWEDVVAGALLAEAVSFARARPLHVVVLLPRREVVAAREAGRAGKGYDAWSVDALYEGFDRHTPRLGLWLDSSDQTPDETVDEILRTAGQTAVW